MLPLLASFSIGLLALTSAQVVEFPSELDRWLVTEPPSRNSDRWSVANHDSQHEWAVTLGDAGPRVKLRGKDGPAPLPFEIEAGSAAEGLAGRRTVARVDDGWIVAFNAGEFGAGLWWFSPDGGSRYRISKDHAQGFFPTGSGLLAIEGLAHLSRSEGKVARLSRDASGRWASEVLVDLGHAPDAAAQDVDGSLVVATTGRLLRVFPATKKVEVLLDRAFWGGLYANSLVIAPAGTIFVGMRHGVAKVETGKTSPKVSWLLPNQAFADQRSIEGSR